MSGLNLNGSTAFAESVKHQFENVRRDWKVEAARMSERLTQGLLELERTMSAARELLATVQDGAPGRDGKDGVDGINGKDGRDGVDGKNGLDGLPGRDGKDGAPGKNGVDGRDGVNGLDGAPGRDGKDGAPGQPGQPGAPGERGEPGLQGVFAAPALFKVGQITYAGHLVYHEGSTYCAVRDTAATPPHVDFQPVAYKGRDGKDGRDGTPGKDAYGGRARGLYDPKQIYRAMDVVTLNGSEWRCIKDNPGPCPGDDWALGAKQGMKGRPGERGERGPPGVGLERVDFDGQVLTLTLSDGKQQQIDLASLIG